MRHADPTLLLCGALFLASCSSLSSDERERLAGHQRNAQYYYEGNKLDQALGQIERGLAIAPDDYKLKVLRGAIELRLSGDAQGTDHRRLDAATAALHEVYGERSDARHEPQLLFVLALAEQKQGLRQLGEALRRRGEAERGGAGADAARAAAADHELLARERFAEARRLLDALTERGELRLLCHYHQLQIAQSLGDDAAFTAQCNLYFVQSAKDLAAIQQRIDSARDLAYEREQRDNLQKLRLQEAEVRVLLADHLYRQQRYEEALPHLDQALQIDGKRADLYYNRGRVLKQLGRVEPAKADFRKFVYLSSLPPSNEKMAFALAVLGQ